MIKDETLAQDYLSVMVASKIMRESYHNDMMQTPATFSINFIDRSHFLLTTHSLAVLLAVVWKYSGNKKHCGENVIYKASVCVREDNNK